MIKAVLIILVVAVLIGVLFLQAVITAIADLHTELRILQIRVDELSKEKENNA